MANYIEGDVHHRQHAEKYYLRTEKLIAASLGLEKS